jgi:hypothetical protein
VSARSQLSFCALVILLAPAAGASPLDLAGFIFNDGERAFADEAVIVSGTLTGPHLFSPQETAQRVLTGSNVGDTLRVINPDEVVFEITFSDNRIVNGPGADLVFFENSGHMDPGTPDPRERFGVSVFDGSGFPAFVIRDPVSTGFVPCGDTTVCLTVFAVEVDLTDFGLPLGATTDRVRLFLFDPLGGTRSGDPTAVGALYSIPEPATGSLVAAGLLLLRVRTGRPARRVCFRRRR